MEKWNDVPADLKILDQWMRWTYIERGGKKNKLPIQLDGTVAKSNDPATWTTFWAVEPYEKIAFVFSDEDGFVGIDLDDCLTVNEDGNVELDDRAELILEVFAGVAYAEISPSQKGLKMIARGSKPPGSRCSDGTGVEMYDSKRFWTITGQTLSKAHCAINAESAQSQIDWFVGTFLKKETQPSKTSKPTIDLSQAIPADHFESRILAYASQMEPAGDGDRNNSAFRNAGHLFAFRDESGNAPDEQTVLGIMEQWNQGLANPLPDSELASVVKSSRINGTAPESKIHIEKEPEVLLTLGQSDSPKKTDAANGKKENPTLQMFPVDAFPSHVADFINGLAEQLQVPVDMVAITVLSAIAGSNMQNVGVQVHDNWTEQVNLFCVTAMDSSNRKSGVYDACFKPLRDCEKEKRESEKVEIGQLQLSRRILEKKLGAAEKRALKDGHEAVKEAQDLQKELDETPVPTATRLTCDDVTAEALERILVNQGSINVCGVEGGIFDTIAGQYTGGKAKIDIFLKGYSGDSHQCDRVGRESVYIEKVTLNLSYLIQPSVLKSIGNNEGNRSKGFVARFLYCVPGGYVGWRDVDPDLVTVDCTERYQNTIKALIMSREERTLQLSPDCFESYLAWATEVEEWLQPHGRLGHMVDWGGKLVGNTIRIAGNIHMTLDCFDFAKSNEIQESTFAQAVRIARWATIHAEEALDVIGRQSDVQEDAEWIMELAGIKQWQKFKPADLTRNHRRFRNENDRRDAALKALVDCKYLTTVPVPGKSGKIAEYWVKV
tara:strand:+ start:1154 stop:3484 length:2331 start_codon:yes stop_codon:yes gene_type:complete